MVSDPARREPIDVDVVVFAIPEPGEPHRILSLGEAKWGTVMGTRHVERLRRARDLLAGRGFDTRDTRLACFGAAGFDRDLATAPPTDTVLIPLERLYAGWRGELWSARSPLNQ